MLALSLRGEQQAAQWGWTLDSHQRTPLVRPCLDWSQRRYHAAGQVGRELAGWLFAQGWVMRKDMDRIVWVTDDGRHALKEWFGLSWPPAAQCCQVKGVISIGVGFASIYGSSSNCRIDAEHSMGSWKASIAALE